MNKQDILLTHKQQNDEYNFLHLFENNPTNRDLSDRICKAQCRKLLDWLVNERLLAHENYTEFKDYEKNFKNWHKPDCRVCEIENHLRG